MLLIGLPTEAVNASAGLRHDRGGASTRALHANDGPAKAVTEGSLVTAWRRPNDNVWMRDFVALLRERGLNGRHP